MLVPLASYAYKQSYSWWDFQVNILAKLRIPPSPPPPLFSSLKILLPSHPLLPSSPPPLKTLTCMPPSHVSHCWRYRWRASVSLQPPCLCLPRYTADRGPHPRHSDGPALPPLLYQVTNGPQRCMYQYNRAIIRRRKSLIRTCWDQGVFR